MINCRQYTRLLHKSSIQPLNLFEKALMKIHYNLCILCRTYTRESEVIDEAIKEIMLEEENAFTEEEIEKLKKQLIEKLKLNE